MMKALSLVNTVFDRIINVLSFLAAVLVVFLMLGVVTEVVMRYFFGRPIIWMVEITEYCLLYIPFLGVAWLLRGEGHVKMDLVLTRFNPRIQAMINIITSILGAITCLIITWFGIESTWDYYQQGFFSPTILQTPAYIILIIIPVGIFLVFIQFLKRAYGYLVNLRSLTG